MKHDLSPVMVKDGKLLCDGKAVRGGKILKMNAQTLRLSCMVEGKYDNAYHCEIEIDRKESIAIDSDCDCSHKYDCQHIAAFLFYLEEHYEEMLVAYSKEANIEQNSDVDEVEKATLLETFQEAEKKDNVRKGKKHQKELLFEYVEASKVLGNSPYFTADANHQIEKAEIAFIIAAVEPGKNLVNFVELQLALRLPFRSKPLNIPNVREFLDAVRYEEPLYIGGKMYCFSLESFDQQYVSILRMVMDCSRFPDSREEKALRVIQIDKAFFGSILAHSFFIAKDHPFSGIQVQEEEKLRSMMPGFYCANLEQPLYYSRSPAKISVDLEYLQSSAPKIFLKPTICLETAVAINQVISFECELPGMIHQNVYYRFNSVISRKHLRHLEHLSVLTIPEPLFGTFVENALPELKRFSEVTNLDIIERFVTLPFVGKLGAECQIQYLDGEFEASLSFVYENIKVPAAFSKSAITDIESFVTNDGIIARNLSEEQKMIEDLFQDFLYDESQGIYKVKNDKKIVEFMTEVIPRNSHRVVFNCPKNLLDQFIYDDTKFAIDLVETDRIDTYVVSLTIEGYLSGTTLDLLWECVASKKAFIELSPKRLTKKNAEGIDLKVQKFLVLDLVKLAPILHILDELGIKTIETGQEKRPLWSLASIDQKRMKSLSLQFTMSQKLQELQEQMLGLRPLQFSDMPKEINATLRSYQVEGVNWLQKLRYMHLNGVLADDMGLGKTLQAITAITQYHIENPQGISLIVCPTSLVYNWKEEFTKFNPSLNVLAIDGLPQYRKELLSSTKGVHVVITSYSLLQKDIDLYKEIAFAYAILDEAQHIKNRGTRNAKSAKMIQAKHRLILTGTPIENSLEELWSLFDFLMPGLLSKYDRFIEKYIREPSKTREEKLELLRRKVSPFILRRMKADVVSELPAISEITYHCHLTDLQKQLYHSYANAAKEELSRMVTKDGFDKVQIHVLATLTRLKQICCHPAIFAKDKVEAGDSGKYDMLMELVHSLIEGNHKTVIFSQYTRMLAILKADLQQMGIRFEYLDGTSKNRMGIVKRFNEDESIPIFLVSLKAGGSGLNLVGADTVIHYDMWWNPAVENQATDRVHRIGQKKSVSAYKLVTLNTIEEKIVELQNRKRGIVQKIVDCDEEAISKLTWEEVLELLQT